MAWVLTKGLTTWRNEINSTFPNRDKASDGSVGDLRHQTGSSGHNPDRTGKAEYKDGDAKDEVRAIDVDKDFKSKFTAEQLVQWLVTLGRAGKVYLPFRYFIYNGRIWRKSTGWKTETYTGPNKHDHHIHFSGDYSQKADEWAGSLGLKAYVAKVLAPKPATPAKPKPPASAGGKLPTYAAGSRTISAALKSVGTDVAYAQRFIGESKMGPADGKAGAKFTAGVKWYQREIMGFSNPDGVLTKGGPTWKRILSA